MLSPSEFSAPEILAALRALNSIADSLCLEQSSEYTSQDGLLHLLYTEKHLASVTDLLSQSSSSLATQHQIALTATLITRTCRNDAQRSMLAHVGVLEALAARITSFVVATGCCWKSPRYEYVLDPVYADIPSAASIKSTLASILEAVGAIIQNSRSWSKKFLSAPAFAVIFKKSDGDVGSSSDRAASTWNPHPPSSFTDRPVSQNPIETLLPQLPSLQHRNSATPSSNFPPLSAIGSTAKQSQVPKAFNLSSEVSQNQAYDSIDDDEDESPLIAWLIFVARSENGITRLMAASVLAIFYRHGLTYKRRETGFAFLLVPLLVQMLDKDSKSSSGVTSIYDPSILRSPEWVIKEQAPAVLAMLAVDSLELQQATVDAGAIKKLSRLLKESYDPLITNPSTSIWNPSPNNAEKSASRPGALKLAANGQSPMAYHMTKMREAVLVALAAIASLKDEYRKAIIDNNVVPFVIESLKLSVTAVPPSVPSSQTEEPKPQKAIVGNPNTVILAACGAARALSRSVSTLRTSLMDAGLAAPLFILLRHQDIDIQIAATAVICNLVLEFSPMREVKSYLQLIVRLILTVSTGYR